MFCRATGTYTTQAIQGPDTNKRNKSTTNTKTHGIHHNQEKFCGFASFTSSCFTSTQMLVKTLCHIPATKLSLHSFLTLSLVAGSAHPNDLSKPVFGKWWPLHIHSSCTVLAQFHSQAEVRPSHECCSQLHPLLRVFHHSWSPVGLVPEPALYSVSWSHLDSQEDRDDSCFSLIIKESTLAKATILAIIKTSR